MIPPTALHPGSSLRCSASNLGPDLDVKWDGGYIVVVPSIHESGRRYEWDNQVGGLGPEWLLKALREPSETLSGRAGTSSSRTRPANLDGGPILSGRRNETLVRMGWIRLPSYRTAGFEPATHGPGNRCSINPVALSNELPT